MRKRAASLVMAVLMLCSLAVYLPSSIVASAVSGTSTYMSGNPYPKYNYENIRSCTSVTWDCVKSNTGVSLPGGLGNGGDWFSNAANNGYMTHTSTPQAGDIACYSGGLGHVAYVIDVNTGSRTMTLYEGGFDWTDKSGVRHTGNVGGGINISYNMNYNIGQGKNGDTGHVLQGFIRPTETGGKELDVGAGYTIPSGDYWIFSELNEKSYVDISGADAVASNGTNVALWSIDNAMPSAHDVYHIEYLGNTFYKITQYNTNQCVEVGGLSKQRGANVQVWSYGGISSQQWSIENSGRGYKIRSRISGFYLDISGGEAENGRNIQVWENNETAAQYFALIPYDPNERPLADGEYKIKSGIDSRYYLDISGTPGSYANGSKAQISNENSDSFILEYVGNGYYKMTEKSSKLNLEITNDDVSYLANYQKAQLWKEASNRGIFWKIRKNSDGTYTLFNQLSGYPLDAAGGVANNGVICQQFMYNGTSAQKWTFEKVSDNTTAFLKGDINSDGKVDTKDAMKAISFAKKTTTPKNDSEFKAADVNGDGKLDSKDALIIINAAKSRQPIK